MPLCLNNHLTLYFYMSSQSSNSVSWKVGLVLTLVGFALVAVGSTMLQFGVIHDDVLTIVRGGLIFIAGISAVVVFGISMRWEFRT
jgi:small neutral amino acid transporter SnatA (MarC family)